MQFEFEVLFLVIKRPRLPRLHEIVRTVEPVCLRMLRLKIELCAVNVCKLQRRAKAFLLGQECLQQRFLLAQGFEQARKLEPLGALLGPPWSCLGCFGSHLRAVEKPLQTLLWPC